MGEKERQNWREKENEREKERESERERMRTREKERQLTTFYPNSAVKNSNDDACLLRKHDTSSITLPKVKLWISGILLYPNICLFKKFNFDQNTFG